MFRFLVGEIDFSLLQNIHSGSGVHLDSYSVVIWNSVAGLWWPGRETHFRLVPRLRMSGAVHLLSNMPLWDEAGQISVCFN
jgi:hypothetical protein